MNPGQREIGTVNRCLYQGSLCTTAPVCPQGIAYPMNESAAGTYTDAYKLESLAKLEIWECGGQ